VSICSVSERKPISRSDKPSIVSMSWLSERARRLSRYTARVSPARR
jgi:hypothetical protein